MKNLKFNSDILGAGEEGRDMRCKGRLCKWSLQTYLTLLTNKQVGHISFINIARGTTNPEIDSVTWTKFGNNIAPLA